MDPLNWLLLAVAAAVLVAISWKKTVESRRISAAVHEPTRRKAHALIPHVTDGAQADLFELQQTPLRIRPTKQLGQLYADPSISSFDPRIAASLWIHQRALLLRLEGELEMHQQAECSQHVAIAAPANQPKDLVSEALSSSEATLGMLCARFGIAEPVRLWHGRALVLMLSNRKFFDHVSWLMDAGLTRSGGGAYVLGQDGVVLIPIYATRVSDTRRIVLRQLVRAFLYAYGGTFGDLPRWIEEGTVRWTEFQRLGAVTPARPDANPAAAGTAAAVTVTEVVDDAAWAASEQDSARQEALILASARLVEGLMRDHAEAVAGLIRAIKSGMPHHESLRASLGGSWSQLLEQAAQQPAARTQPTVANPGPFNVISSQDLF